MASNNPSDPQIGAPVGNPATPQSGPGGTVPDFPLPSVSPQAPQEQPEQQVAPATPSSSDGHAGQRRLPPGTQLSSGRYRIEKLVAAGGMGAVYRAIDTRFNRPCAVKEMLDDFQNETELNQAVEWFRREATLLLDLNHVCIPRVRDFFREQDKHYLVMDFIEGRTLGEVLEKEGNVQGLNGARGIAEARARKWAQQVCSVLEYLHNQTPPIIFRDLKPSNIMVTDHDAIKLIDFGIARTFQSQRQSTIIMTIGYAAPEQLHGMPEPRSDIYALGATMHRLLTHHDAANNKPSIFSFPMIRALRPDISPAFEQVIMKALEPNLEQRWRNAGEMEKALSGLPSVVSTPGPIAPRAAAAAQPYPPIVNPQTPSGPQSSVIAGGITGPGGAYIRAAQDHLNAGRLDPAYASIQQAHAVEPNNALVHKIFGQVFARRIPAAPDLALQAYTRSLQLNPNDAETHKLVGDLYLFLRRQPAQAIQPYTQSLRLSPTNFEAHQRLAKCYEEMNQLEPALREYQEAARLAPKRPEIQYAVGQLAWRLNQLPGAERAFVQVLTINPADHQTRFLLSQVYEREGRLEDALRECSYVIAAMPSNSAAQAMLQRLRVQLRR